MEKMNADQGFRRAPGSLLRVAAGAGATALIVTVVSAARRAGTARASRDSGPAQDSSEVPAAPKAGKASDLAVGQIAISAALLLFTATALPAIVGRRRDGGKRGAAHARTSRRQAENGDGAFPPEIPADIGDPWIIGAPGSVRPDPARHDVEQLRHGAQRPRYEAHRSQPADDSPSWPGRPVPAAPPPDPPGGGGGLTAPRGDSTEAALR